MGQVIIFNPSTSRVKYKVNGTLITPARGASPSNGYRPEEVAVERVGWHASPEGRFGYGPNNFQAEFLDYKPPAQQVHNYRLSVPESVSVVDDLILYVFKTQLFFMTCRGYPVQKTGFIGSGEPLSSDCS